jgi:hypothetical protein
MSIVVVALVSDKSLVGDTLRLWLSLAAAFVSGFIAVLVWRTRILVDRVIEKTRDIPTHPYKIIYDEIAEDQRLLPIYRKSASTVISAVPWLATIAFFVFF